MTIRLVTQNPAIDVSMADGEMRRELGGKGNNIAKMLIRLGYHDIMTYGFEGGERGEELKGMLDDRCIPHSYTPIDFETRETEVLSPRMGGKKHNPSPYVTEREHDDLRDRLFSDTGEGDIVVFAGSIPRGVPNDTYFTLIQDADNRGAITVLDASQEIPMIKGLMAGPHITKPNRQECRWVTDTHIGSSVSDIAREAESISTTYGVRTVLISIDRDGAINYTRGYRAFQRTAPIVDEVLNTVGPGDFFLGGYLFGEVTRVRKEEEKLRLAIACGSAHICLAGNTELDVSLANNFFNQALEPVYF